MKNSSHAEGHSLPELIEHASHLLPAQGPIDVFIHHNTLHAFEGMHFEDAVVAASRKFGTEPFMTERQYRDALTSGRIRERDLNAVIDERCPRSAALAGGRVPIRTLWRALLLHGLELESDASAAWSIEEGGAIVGNEAQERAKERWEACLTAVREVPWMSGAPAPPARLRDLMVIADPACDPDALVHPFLIRLSAAYLDQGIAAWPMPDRDRGFLAAITGTWSSRIGPAHGWIRGLRGDLEAIQGLDALTVIRMELDALGTAEPEEREVIERSMLALRGWAGMFRQLEERPDRAPLVRVPARLADFLAARLVMDRVAAMSLARHTNVFRTHGAATPAELRSRLRASCPSSMPPGSIARALHLHRLTRLVEMTPEDLRSVAVDDLAGLERAAMAFDGVERRRLLHLAYERRHRSMILDALALHRAPAVMDHTPRPRFQAVLCIDERFESFRRHLEELGPDRETFGAAGFFAIAMYYRGVDDWHTSPLCPIVMTPSHTVLEVPEDGSADHLEDWRRLRRAMGRFSGAMVSGGRTLVGGSVFSAMAGAIAAVPLVARVATPRRTARLAAATRRIARRSVRTQLALERVDPLPLPDGTMAGFSVEEMTAIARRLLEDIGLTRRFARTIVVLGHGSSSQNNPFASAYDCGACGGGRGGPNARAIAAIANDPRVRSGLREHGIDIPDDTIFIGGFSDTCSDAVILFDADSAAPSHREEIDFVRSELERAAMRSAQERCRRYESAPPPSAGPEAALRHVQDRSEDLAQVRPEFGHATNAVCIVGRRYRSRGLFLDRRAFLVSYDPTQDPAGEVLQRTLGAVAPVCGGISLEYFFSSIDRTGYGCGTKLPHNITGLLGVMDGHASDLRTGLPVQTTEIHEPMRLLMAIDAPEQRIHEALKGLPAVARLVTNAWIRIARWDEDGSVHFLEGDRFERHAPEIDRLPEVERSADWALGHRGNLSPASIRAGAHPAGGRR